MKENFLDTLMYLFENYVDEGANIPDHPAIVSAEMMEAGFLPVEIDKALNWFGELRQSMTGFHKKDFKGLSSFRVYTMGEVLKISSEARDYLLRLERQGVIDIKSRELVIDRAMALDAFVVDVSEIKWVVFMVLFNQSAHKNELEWMENIVFENRPNIAH